MIAAVTTAEQKAEFAAAVRDVPHFRAVMGTELALWADNPGAPAKLYMASGAALSISGGRALLCGALANETPSDAAYEELDGFLRFCGVERLLCSTAPPCQSEIKWQEDIRYTRFITETALPVPPLPQLSGGPLTLEEHPSLMPAAKLLFSQDEAQQEYFYTVGCTAVNHGYGTSLALMQNGKLVTTVGCYERANGEAYMAAGETVPELRGHGLGAWLILTLSNKLQAEGDEVSLLCETRLCPFYRRLGFAETGAYSQYRITPKA